MKVHNTTIFMGDATKQQRKNGLQQEDEQKRGSVFAGNLNKNFDPIARKKQDAQKQAMKIVGDAWAGERKIDDDLEARRSRIDELRDIMGKAGDELKNIDNQRTELRDSYGLTEESEEQQDLHLLEKELDSHKIGSGVTLTDEEKERVAQIKERGLTEYQERSLELRSSKEYFEKNYTEAEDAIREENAVIRGIRQARLQSHVMADANKQAEEVLAAASDEIIGMLMEEAKEHIDEKMAEEKEAAEKKAEEKEELEEKLEKAEEKKEEQEKLTEEIKESTEELVEIEGVETDIQSEVQKIVDKMKLIEEDIKGAAVDATV